MSSIEYSPIPAEAFRHHMNDFAAATGCVRLHQGQPIGNLHGLGQAVEFTRIKRSQETLRLVLFDGLEIDCLTEISDSKFAIQRSSVAYLGVILPNGISGHISLETIDERRQATVEQEDEPIVSARFSRHVGPQYWSMGISLNEHLGLRGVSFSVNYPVKSGETAVDKMTHNFSTGLTTALLGSEFDVNLAHGAHYLERKAQRISLIKASMERNNINLDVNRVSQVLSQSATETLCWSGLVGYDNSPFLGTASIFYKDGLLQMKGDQAEWNIPVQPRGVDLVSAQAQRYTGENLAVVFERALSAFESVVPRFDFQIPNVSLFE